MKQWNFPSANGLGIQGISNSGVETFKGKIMESLTREICQNSLDATNGKKPVKLEFYKTSITKDSFPGYEKLKKYMYDAKKYWTERNNKKSMDFFDNACRILECNDIPVLRISDFNTTGLTGSDDKVKNSAWFSMVYSDGVSNKSGSSSGSYGIGKSSIYAASSLRTVFFNTYDISGKSAAEGVSKLATFITNGDEKFGTGFYGNVNYDGNTYCCETIEELDNINYRTNYGTDIYIMGFNNYSDWKDKIIISLLENFLLAIYDGELEVNVQNIVVDKNNVEQLLKKYKDGKDGCASAYNYYQVLTSDENVYENTNLFQNVSGKVKLKVVIFKDSLANRSVLMSRSNGMKLFDKKQISKSIQFSAILTMEGDSLNQYFARMEDPTHTSWQPDRYEQEYKIKDAEKNLKILNKWIKETIIQKGTESYGEEIDIKGMEGLLPEFYELSLNKKKHESLENKMSKVFVNKKNKSKHSINIKTSTNGNAYYEYKGTGALDDEGEYESIDVPHNKHSKDKSGEGAPHQGNDSEGNRPIIKFSEVNNYKKRMFISDINKNEYTIKITVNQNIEDCRLQIYIAGETTNIEANVISAVSNGKSLKIHQNTIHIGRLFKGFSTIIRFSIESNFQCNLEAKLYANKK